ncbi:MAG: XapX domain-containing protein [Candidatus Yanofskybacteria bacterium RIFCSPHIGHO2_01_FULL_45_42]|uniref:XapX domain-containing protein n=3 Tax=Candidatus Yanofskyibacteriota TaxID=1752733 RepID=A0A1F8F5D5_9BACT|nr:MAG: XapX domain-containing protein [Candidatus Yanofskybacteria bacterium RIFCSPHIGHO2_01_FULL_45_42]OGN15845.1 MAG: XapX domain-containing protein [Candidatus Yanofskybacteria bacterium RIFCSPHIGHO2_02_FULL_46_19]OGN26056.1 MAG: XapX domain-containing protein [Candidatus Yanofskybacteria bacterium RIFCSPLOWO2_01_FULL_45_72]OGN32283.1 MAG: XapX domain-containing protein [Candidatus Yanofskybacteria bacterium RIFCSPLOWO2_02_FULL_45_18]
MILLIKALFTGLVVGLVFGLLKFPIPAPGALAGVLGVVGIYLGFLATKLFTR